MQIDDLIEDNFIIKEKIGGGGFGSIWKAFDREQGKVVAVKKLRRRWSGSQKMVCFFKDEFETLMRCSHPHIIRPLRFLKNNGNYLFVMEYLKGGNLDERIHNHGVIEIKTALSLTLKMLNAINTYSKLNLIHGDIKPSNIIFRDDSFNYPKLGDFGLVKTAIQQLNPMTCRGEQKIVGTPAYMPPEKLEGRKLSIKSDIYSLGMTLYKMLAGRLFFNDDILDYSEVLCAVRNPSREKPSRYRPEISDWLDRLVIQMISKEIHKRPGSTFEIEQIIRCNYTEEKTKIGGKKECTE